MSTPDDSVNPAEGSNPVASINVVGVGSASQAPDQVSITASISRSARGVAAALQGSSDLAASALKRLRKLGIASDDIGTESITVQPDYDNNGTVRGQRGQHTLSILLRDIAQVGPVLDALTDAAGDGLGVPDVSLLVGDQRGVRDQALEAALADARHSAQRLAAACGRTLGDVLEVSEAGPAGAVPRPAFAMARAKGFAADSVAPGTSSITVTLRVVFELR